MVNSLFGSCSYVMDGAWVVDVGDVKPLRQLIDRHGGLLRGILLTHGHFDHIYGLNDLIEAYPEATVYCSDWCREQLLDDKLNLSLYHGTPFVFNYPDKIQTVTDGDVIELDQGMSLQAVATPGHTPGCITWIGDDIIFTGDAFIPGIKVVTNLPYGNKELAEKSASLISGMSRGRTIYPGHPTHNPA